MPGRQGPLAAQLLDQNSICSDMPHKCGSVTSAIYEEVSY